MSAHHLRGLRAAKSRVDTVVLDVGADENHRGVELLTLLFRENRRPERLLLEHLFGRGLGPGTAEMRREHDRRSRLERVLNRRDHRHEPCVVADGLTLERDVEVRRLLPPAS